MIWISRTHCIIIINTVTLRLASAKLKVPARLRHEEAGEFCSPGVRREAVCANMCVCSMMGEKINNTHDDPVEVQ